MRRPDPLPSRPQPTPEDPRESLDDEVEVAPTRFGKPKRTTKADEERSAEDAEPTSVDDIETDVDIDLDDAALLGLDEPSENSDHLTTAVITPLDNARKKKSLVRPSTLPATLEASGDDDAASSSDDSDDDVAAEAAEESPAVGIRDVWRAARAKRKALRSEVRRFTVRSRRRRLIWLSSLGAIILLIAGSISVAYSPLFAVQKITVQGAAAIDPAAIQEALNGEVGKPLALVSDSDIKAALVTFPFVETYSVQARPPHELVISIVERTPVGVIGTDAGFSVVDAAGVILSTTPEQPPGQPVLTIEGGIGSAAFTSAGMVIRSLPEQLRASLTAVTATTPSDVTLTLAPDGVQVIWGNADNAQDKIHALEGGMKAVANTPLENISVYDVSSPSAIVMR